MDKLDRFVSNSLFKIIMPVCGLLIMTLFGALYAQTTDTVITNRKAIEKHCDTTNKKFDKKVDVIDFNRTLKLMEKNNDRQWETTQELIKGVQKLQTDVTIIKEKLK